MPNQELVSILVPKDLVMDIYRWISTRGQSVEVGAATPPSPQAMVWPPPRGEADTGWTEEEVAKLVRESPPGMIYILRYLANNPDKDVPTRDLAKSLTHKPHANSSTVAGTLGAFGRRVKNRHKRGWPMSQLWDEGEQCCFYRMPSENAEKIRSYLPLD